jgi:transposase
MSEEASVAKRRNRSKQERRGIVEETFKPGASVAVIARAHGVNANQVFHWRKLYHEGLLDVTLASTPLMPVRITEVVSEAPSPSKACSGTIHIELGRTRIRVEGSVDTENLRIILEHLGR